MVLDGVVDQLIQREIFHFFLWVFAFDCCCLDKFEVEENWVLAEESLRLDFELMARVFLVKAMVEL